MKKSIVLVCSFILLFAPPNILYAQTSYEFINQPIDEIVLPYLCMKE